MKSKGRVLGAWAFLIGVILAIVLGVFGTNSWILALLVIAGILVGLLNVTDEESSGFLLAGVSLVLVSWLGQDSLSAFATVSIGSLQIGSMLIGILSALLILFVPATIIVALKSVFDLAKN
ncbi:Uncharacterised protein [uncultured archaeon]|nr:Uncharacterised protein [uncultured archaeon]